MRRRILTLSTAWRIFFFGTEIKNFGVSTSALRALLIRHTTLNGNANEASAPDCFENNDSMAITEQSLLDLSRGYCFIGAS